jgi:hypothetical protein
MIINSLSVLFGGKERSVDFDEKLNLIYGGTNEGKTLIYRVLDFVVGASQTSHLDEKSLLTFFPSLEGFKAMVTSNGKHYCIRRSYPSGDYAIASEDNPQEAAVTDMNSFMLKEINLPIGSKLVTGKNLRTSSITYREYAKTIFFPEDRITESKSFAFIDSIEDTTKYQNLFCYLLTGVSLNYSDNIKTVRKERNAFKSLKTLQPTFQTAFHKTYPDLSSEDKTLMDEYGRDLPKLKIQKEAAENEYKQLNSKLDSLGFEQRKLNSFYALLVEKETNLSLAQEFEQYLKAYSVICPHCGKTLSIDFDAQQDKEIPSSEVQQSLFYKQGEIAKGERELSALEERLAELNNQIAKESQFLEDKQKVLSEQSAIESFFKTFLTETEEKDDSKFLRPKDSPSFVTSINEICDYIHQKLLKNKTLYLGQGIVGFDYDTKVFDFTLDGKSRTILGKGLRTIFTLLMLCKIDDLLIKRNCFLGFSLVDSPWTTMQLPSKNEENLWADLLLEAMKENGTQFILFDNQKKGSPLNYKSIDVRDFLGN